MPMGRALDTLKKGLGTQWHPVVGATFVQLMLEDIDAQRSDPDTVINPPNVAA